MKKNISFLSTIFVLSLLLAAPLKSEANSGFALGLATGSAMSSSNNQRYIAGNNTIYILPNLEERLLEEEYLNIRVFSIDGNLSISDGRKKNLFSTKSFMEIFHMGAKKLNINYKEYLILKIERFFIPRNERTLYIFTYIEKSKINNVK